MEHKKSNQRQQIKEQSLFDMMNEIIDKSPNEPIKLTIHNINGGKRQVSFKIT